MIRQGCAVNSDTATTTAPHDELTRKILDLASTALVRSWNVTSAQIHDVNEKRRTLEESLLRLHQSPTDAENAKRLVAIQDLAQSLIEKVRNQTLGNKLRLELQTVGQQHVHGLVNTVTEALASGRAVLIERYPDQPSAERIADLKIAFDPATPGGSENAEPLASISVSEMWYPHREQRSLFDRLLESAALRTGFRRSAHLHGDSQFQGGNARYELSISGDFQSAGSSAVAIEFFQLLANHQTKKEPSARSDLPQILQRWRDSCKVTFRDAFESDDWR